MMCYLILYKKKAHYNNIFEAEMQYESLILHVIEYKCSNVISLIITLKQYVTMIISYVCIQTNLKFIYIKLKLFYLILWRGFLAFLLIVDLSDCLYTRTIK